MRQAPLQRFQAQRLTAYGNSDAALLHHAVYVGHLDWGMREVTSFIDIRPAGIKWNSMAQ